MNPVPEPRIKNFENLGYGLFLHWGLYSLLGRGEWVMDREKIPVEDYRKLKDQFTADQFDARAIARMAKRAGMRYITLTTRHHDGFSLYDAGGVSDFDAPHSAAKRDLVQEFVDGCRAEGIIPFFYHTTLDWRWDSAHCDEATFNEYLNYLLASVEVLCTSYGPIGGLWFDGNWSRTDLDWNEDRLYAMIRNHQPEAMIINNSGLSARGVLGHPEIDSVTFEQGLPSSRDQTGNPKYVSAEMCRTLNAHWGVGTCDFNYLSPKEIIEEFCLCRKAGANLLLNVGPEASGKIPAYEAAALERAGDWLKMHDEAVYAGRPTGIQCEGRDFVLQANGRYYYFAFDLSIEGHTDVTVGSGSRGGRTMQGFTEVVGQIRWLDNGQDLAYQQHPDNSLTLVCTGFPYGTHLVVRVAEILPASLD